MTGDAWRPAASLDMLRQRAALLHRVRAFFWQRGVLEVETPQWLPSVAPEVHQDPIVCAQGFLHTSPETAMKRLLAAGSGPIYQICRAFRANESGALHNPEFTILEWYRPGWSLRELMVEVEQLLWAVLTVSPGVDRWGDAGQAAILTYAAAFQCWAGIDPFADSDADLRAACRRGGGCSVADGLADSLDRAALLDLLLVQQVEPGLRERGGAVFLVDFPPEAAAMAQVDPGPPPLARRFELYLDGVELANGYQELTDPQEQRRRLVEANQQRRALGKWPLPLDEPFLQALEQGLPDCAGVAIGLDRLIMLALGARQIREVMAFPSVL
ncbi:MAG: EF-P lysine aminoacylase GenX [Magnetococcales bacterium]|nr:EF-P lysine aminoacylase GenX [Magnetococcales bacterium]